MLWLARTAQRGRVQAALVAAATTGLVMVVGCAVVALTTLRQSPRESIWVMAIGAAALALLVAPAFGLQVATAVATMVVLGCWLPVGIVALVLRYTKALPAAMLTAAGMAVGLLVLIHVLTGDPAAAWVAMADRTAESIRAEHQVIPAETEQLLERVRESAPGLTGIVVSGWMTLLILGLLLGRYWQAGLDQPGAFGKEFRTLQFGATLAIVAVGLFAAALIVDLPWLTTVAVIVTTLFVFQGLAVVHDVVERRGLGRGWLIGLYILLVVSPISSVCALLGVLDSWVDVRGRLAA